MDQQQNSVACVFCDQTFPTKEELVEHFRSHAEYGKNETKIRSKVTEKCNSQNSKEIIVKCDDCSEEFSNVTKAITHKYKKHPNSKTSHFCPWCGKLFPLKHILNIHLESHANDTGNAVRLHCEECDIYFYCDDALKYHNSSFHLNTFHYQNVVIPPPSKKIYINGFGDVHSIYYCHLCGNEYVVKYNLQKHVKLIHDNETTKPDNIIKCTTCDALFYNLKAYDFHNTFHRESDLYITSEQMRKQVVTRIDQDFDIRRVQTSHLSFEKKMRMNPSLLEEQRKYAEAVKNSIYNNKPEAGCNYEESNNSVALTKNDHVDNVDNIEMTPFDYKPNRTYVKSKKPSFPNESLSVITSETNTIQPKPAARLKVVPKETLEKMKSEGLISLMKASNNIKNLKSVKMIKSSAQNSETCSKPSTTEEPATSSKNSSKEIQNDFLNESNIHCLGFQTSLDIISKRRAKRNILNFTSAKSQKKSISDLKRQYSIKKCNVVLKRLQNVSSTPKLRKKKNSRH